jgi:hypothetical protein
VTAAATTTLTIEATSTTTLCTPTQFYLKSGNGAGTGESYLDAAYPQASQVSSISDASKYSLDAEGRLYTYSASLESNICASGVKQLLSPVY